MKTSASCLLAPALLLALLCAEAQAVEDETCVACHGDPEIAAVTPRGKRLKLRVPAEVLGGSVHEGLACTDCHQGADSFLQVPHASRPLRLGCPDCHADAADSYTRSDAHGRGYARGNQAPYCDGCHGGHQIKAVKDPESRVSALNQPITCGRCHSQEGVNQTEGITKRNLVQRYRSSVHWTALQEGKKAASCSDCHGTHNILSSESPHSTISRTGIVEVCGKCHPPETKAYVDGAHGRPLLHGNHDVPVCITCHGDHDMTSLRERSGDARTWAATQVCIWCHSNERMMARYALDTTPVQSYLRDFHGLTQRGTLGTSATCADCHDAHRSLPEDHPESRMHISNRGTTCGQCHGQAGRSFIMSFSHRSAALTKPPELVIQRVVRLIYIWLIVVVVALMLIHNLVIWNWALRRKRRQVRHQRSVRRMTRFEVISHMVMFLSFTVLAISGFALLLPDAFWVRWLFAAGVTEPVRAWTHRVSAIAMTADLLVFGGYMMLCRRGRGVLRGLWPRLLQDLKDLGATMSFYLGRRSERPKYATFSYVEKAEFWALLWGSVIMIITGLVLWFPKQLPADWPVWVIDVARTIHLFEAILASAAIVIWHFFHTIFHPDEYPMSMTWISGLMTEDEARHRYRDEAIADMGGSQPPPDGGEDPLG